MHKHIIVRLAIYYLALLLVLGGLFVAFPALGGYMAAERARQGGRASLELDRAPEAARAVPELTGPAQLLDPERSVPVLLSLLTAPLIVLPVVWVYGWTRPRRRYNQTFAHTLLIVPVAIALVVFLVKGSLALAFSLAGIVAAVRFRTTLDEPMDAVYLFLVVGTGLAAGVQLLSVAFIASIVFNAVALTVWWTNVGSEPTALDGWRIAAARPAVRLPDAGGVARGDRDSGAEEPGGPYNARLRLHVTNVDEAQRFAMAFLADHAKKWQVADVLPEEGGTSVIEFDLRLKKSADLAAFVRELEQGDPHVAKVELTRTKSKKSGAE